MKFTELKKQVILSDSFVGKRIYDRRYQDFFTVTKRDKRFFIVAYENKTTAPTKESVSSFNSYFDAKIYSIAI